MHKTHIFDQKIKKITDLPTLFFFRTITGNQQFIYLGLMVLVLVSYSAGAQSVVAVWPSLVQ